MGKINNSVEIIPIDGPSGLHTNSRQIVKIDPPQKERMNFTLNDPFIVQRVRQYLEANVDKTYVDITDMAEHLQSKYREYTRRKKSAFRGLVKKAYSIVVRSYGGNDYAASSSESDVEDCDDEEEHMNTMNDQLLEMYNRQQKLPAPDENELIDISSDDSDTEFNKILDPEKEKPPTNGPTTTLLPTPNNPENDRKTILSRMLTSELPNEQTNTDRSKKRKLDAISSTPSKRKKEVAALQESVFSFKDIGGINEVLKEVCQLLVHIKHPEIYRQIGISPPRGFLLHGPPGCGKTLLANAISGELKIPLLKVAATELVGGISGESEERIRELFEKAVDSAPCVLFIDEVDAITQNRQQAQKDMERRIVAQLLTCLDDLSQSENGDRVLVIGATNRPDSLDPALRRAGRFDREVCLGIPNIESRIEILKVLTKTLKLAPDFDYTFVAKNSPGYVGADLMALTREAAMAAINRVFANQKTILDAEIVIEKPETEKVEEVKDDEQAQVSSQTSEIVAESVVENVAESTSDLQPIKESPEITFDIKKATLEELISWLHGQAPLSKEELQNLSITLTDFQKALKIVQPSSKREGFATVPDVTWDDIGSLQDIRQELQMSILAPVRYADQFRSLGLNTPTGVLLCGPPGCGKTLLAKAIANEAGINFISVKGPELLNMYVGESERAVRQCFQRARNSVPCVIFFDELDALCPKRSDSGEGGASMRVVNQMLTEMDGIEGRNGVYLMAASNRPDIVDPAVLRPGRLDKIMYVGLPSAEDRVDILKAITKKGPILHSDVNLELIGKCEKCEGYTGADLAALVREAALEALREIMNTGNDTQVVNNEHFQKALQKIRPSVSDKDQKHYEKLRKLYGPITDSPSLTEEEIMECS